jgi:phosphate transport system substrate-binding protein
MKASRPLKIAVAAIAIAVLGSNAALAADVTITGDGSSFAAPLLNACKVQWQKDNPTYTLGSYGANGSGTGRTNSDKGIGDFNFTDAIHTTAKAGVVHIPVVAAPIAITYNLLGRKDLYLSQATLSDIFAGKITKWNDPAIVADNNGTSTKVLYKEDAAGNPVKDEAGKPVVLRTLTVKKRFTLPNQTINLVTRSDGSGSTQNLVNMFIKQFPTTWTKPSSSTFANVFPGNINDISNIGRITAVKGSALMAATVKKIKFSIGYVESSYATKNELGVAAIQNAAGNFQAPDAAGTAAFLSAATATADGKLTFDYNTKESGAYVLGIVSYALVDTAKTGDSAKAAKSFLTYVLNPACPKTDSTLEYTTITGNLLKVNQALLAKL